MRVLALDTTTPAGSVALVVDEGDRRAIDERRGDAARTHAERLPGEITSVLDAHGLDAGAIDLFAVAAGPGSFTGLRIGIATMQGLAFVAGRPLVGVSALDALAQAASVDARPGALVAAWMDAHRREVFSALYGVADPDPESAGRLHEIEPAAVGPPGETLARWAQLGVGEPALVAGDGAVLYRDVIRGRHAAAAVVPAPLLAATIARLAIAGARAGRATDPAAIRPLYVRRPDAELAKRPS